MKVISISKVKDYKEKDIQVNGWVYSTRRSGKIGFLSIRDGSGILQCIVEKASVGDELFELFKSLTQESSLTVFGKIVENPNVGGYELLLSQLKVHQLTSNYPISPKNMVLIF